MSTYQDKLKEIILQKQEIEFLPVDDKMHLVDGSLWRLIQQFKDLKELAVDNAKKEEIENAIVELERIDTSDVKEGLKLTRGSKATKADKTQLRKDYNQVIFAVRNATEGVR